MMDLPVASWPVTTRWMEKTDMDSHDYEVGSTRSAAAAVLNDPRSHTIVRDSTSGVPPTRELASAKSSALIAVRINALLSAAFHRSTAAVGVLR
jgi:hypothetical protein